MSRQERETWQRQLATDTVLRAAWDDFRAILAVSAQHAKDGQPVPLTDLRQAADRIRAAAGDDPTEP